MKKKNGVAIGIFVAVLLFLLVGTTVAQMNYVATETNNESQIKTQYREALSRLPYLSLSDEDEVPYHSQTPNKAAIGQSETTSETDKQVVENRQKLHHELPKFTPNDKYVEVNGNVPMFTLAELSEPLEPWEKYGNLDRFNRVTEANALLSVEMMPADEESRSSLYHVEPTAWRQRRYPDHVEGAWLYNRSHLIGYQLTGQQDNILNLMTGTRSFNADGMLPFENYVANYIEKREVHVRYRVTPLFIGNELLARGVFMEGYSIEDKGKLSFHIFVPNHQKGIHLNYLDGSSSIE